MYSVSNNYLNLIKSNVRQIGWNGIISLESGDVSFGVEDILSGSLNRQISGNKLEIGTVYTSELDLELVLPSVSRYELFGRTVTLYSTLTGASDVVPMGVFTISDATQTADHINITAYDSMIKFDKINFVPSRYTDILLPSEWLTLFCSAAGVRNAVTAGVLGELPNGLRPMGYADVVGDVDTLRDALSYLATALGCICYIDRSDRLQLKKYSGVITDIVPSSFRFSSELSDFKTTYNGLYCVYKNTGVQEYVENQNTDGLVLDLGANPFLQFSVDENREAALQEIIDAWSGIYYVPFKADMPLVPIYDPGDVLLFTDNQATMSDICVITDITYNIGGNMSMRCSGENPLLADAKDRFSKVVSGVNSDYNNGQETGGKDFWVLHTTNTAAVGISSTPVELGEIEWTQTVDLMRLGLMFTCECDLTTASDVTVVLTVDDDAEYTFSVTDKKVKCGQGVFTVDCGFSVFGRGYHAAKVYMSVVDNALVWGDLG